MKGKYVGYQMMISEKENILKVIFMPAQEAGKKTVPLKAVREKEIIGQSKIHLNEKYSREI